MITNIDNSDGAEVSLARRFRLGDLTHSGVIAGESLRNLVCAD